ncbi:hypothetical protein SAMN05216215_107535 [Saccharopolyspora shandongensis]|uniref:Uncharacterized protein n=1 Tax=Saccharopolyspora shandongensis TaxID=418495 RepID=A0A1H3T584_9PSEU|nr:hypothetical protein SAMN05216215_107535 [Saccharopolyspora shandongensis]
MKWQRPAQKPQWCSAARSTGPIPLGASAWVCGGFPSARNSGPPVSAGSPTLAKLVQ